MENSITIKQIARIKTDFPTKFGIPRQSGIVEGLTAKIIFEPEYRNISAFRGLEDFSHIWIIWNFSECAREGWSPTVRPPRLGGNVRMGVFATRSPFRPNHIGLSAVRLLKIENDKEYGPVLVVSGADLMDGTPIFDIKPYIPYTDSRTDAVGGFSEAVYSQFLEVEIPEHLTSIMPIEMLEPLKSVLSNDPRPHYQSDPNREYGFGFSCYEIKFKVCENKLTVTDIYKK